MCVGCMQMVDAAAGGVIYSRDPMDIRSDAIFINAVHGLAKTVVDGSATPDLLVISRKEPLSIIKKEISHKEHKFICLPEEGVCREVTNEYSSQAAISDEQALELARYALRLEEHFQGPQDIEWSIDETGQIYILQSRPLQQMMVAEREERILTSDITNSIILRGGEMASPGVAAGPAYLVANNLDLLQFPEGAVLVTAFPHPNWAPVLSRSVALVTDRGGITGHLANVSREFHLPALFNTGEATKKIKNGDIITVDAEGHTVYEGRVESLLALANRQDKLMVGTPVYETLKEVMTNITPLNLTNPDSQDFRIKNCRTLHDITRYVHEVSVKELFDYEKNKTLSKHFIKRLVAEVPYAVVCAGSGGRFCRGYPRPGDSPVENRLGADVGLMAGDYGGEVGRATAYRCGRVYVHHRPGRHQPQSGRGWTLSIREHQLFYDFQKLLQSHFPFRLPFFHGGSFSGGQSP